MNPIHSKTVIIVSEQKFQMEMSTRNGKARLGTTVIKTSSAVPQRAGLLSLPESGFVPLFFCELIFLVFLVVPCWVNKFLTFALVP